MPLLRSFVRRLLALFSRDRLEDDLADELQFHLDMEIEENQRRGMEPSEARRAALLRLGGLDQTKVLYRDQRGLPWLEALLQDLRQAARTLRRSPGFTAVAVLSLALGIGTNTAIFSIANALVLRPLPYDEPDRLLRLFENGITQGSYAEGTVSMPNLEEWRRGSTTFEEMAAYSNTGANLVSDGVAARVAGARVEAGVFRALGVEPARGRVILDEENVFGREQVVVLGHGLWLRQFDGDPDIVGRTVTINGAAHDVVGVMPPGFEFPPRSGAEVWLPLYLSPEHPVQ